MDQTLNTPKPTLEKQIAFVHDARKLVEEGHTVQYDEKNIEMFRAIEENLCTVKLYEAHA